MAFAIAWAVGTVTIAGMTANPFLKWAGGKGRLAAAILARAPTHIEAYHEPFAGGAAVFFAMRNGGFRGPATLSDASRELIDVFTVVRDDCDGLISELRRLADRYMYADDRAAVYYEVRAHVPLATVERAARTIFLNKTCYNGLYRVNRQGGFNVPHGRYAHPRIYDDENLHACAAALAGCALIQEDFEPACDRAQPGALVYLDPPYQPLSKTSSFTGYTADSFGMPEQERLRDTFERLTARGVAAVLSNSDHPHVRELYGDRGYEFVEVTMSRAINSVGTGRTPVGELLISNTSRAEVRATIG